MGQTIARAWMNVAEAAAALEVSRETINRYVQSGVVTSRQLPSYQRIQVLRADIERLATETIHGNRAAVVAV